MIFGIGIDMEEVPRIEERVRNQSGLKEKLFTSREIEYCEARKHSAQNFAARFAAKEAFMKALGIGWRKGLAFGQIEVVNDELGKPKLELHGKAAEMLTVNDITSVRLSMTHTNDLASAIVILEKQTGVNR